MKRQPFPSMPVCTFHCLTPTWTLSSTSTAVRATERRPNPDLPMWRNTLEDQDAQAVTEPVSAALSSPVTNIITTSAGVDRSIFLMSPEGPTEAKALSSTFCDTPGISGSEHVFTKRPGGPDSRASPSSLSRLSEGPSYCRRVS